MGVLSRLTKLKTPRFGISCDSQRDIPRRSPRVCIEHVSVLTVTALKTEKERDYSYVGALVRVHQSLLWTCGEWVARLSTGRRCRLFAFSCLETNHAS